MSYTTYNKLIIGSVWNFGDVGLPFVFKPTNCSPLCGGSIYPKPGLV
jgi:hypothetical protein